MKTGQYADGSPIETQDDLTEYAAGYAKAEKLPGGDAMKPVHVQLREAAAFGETWFRCERALPEEWRLELSGDEDGPYFASATYRYSLRYYRANVGPARSVPYEQAHAPTPTAALTALAERLEALNAAG